MKYKVYGRKISGNETVETIVKANNEIEAIEKANIEFPDTNFSKAKNYTTAVKSEKKKKPLGKSVGGKVIEGAIGILDNLGKSGQQMMQNPKGGGGSGYTCKECGGLMNFIGKSKVKCMVCGRETKV